MSVVSTFNGKPSVGEYIRGMVISGKQHVVSIFVGPIMVYRRYSYLFVAASPFGGRSGMSVKCDNEKSIKMYNNSTFVYYYVNEFNMCVVCVVFLWRIYVATCRIFTFTARVSGDAENLLIIFWKMIDNNSLNLKNSFFYMKHRIFFRLCRILCFI